MRVDEILQGLFDELYKILSGRNDYALKGGYIVSNFITSGDVRKTSDIDLSVENEKAFESISEKLIPYLESLKSNGTIFSYSIKKPEVSKTFNKSGSIKLYHKPYIDKPKRILCGIDISIHNLSFGVSEIKGLKVFTVERMLIDKVSVLYKDKASILRRCRDLYDMYIFSILNLTVNADLLKECMRYRNIDISKLSTFEIMIQENIEGLKLELQTLITDGKRVSIEYAEEIGLTTEDIIKETLLVLDFLRKECI